MRKLKLLLVTLALIVGGALSSWADTTLLTAGDGWQKITEMPTDVSLYYFTIVDNNQDLMLTLSRGLNSHQGTDYNGLFYGTSANPLIDKSKLFSLEKDGENYVLRNVEYNGYFLQTENNAAWNYRTHDNGGGGKSWGHIKFTYGEGVWTIQNAKYAVDNGNYMGMWDNAAPANGKDIALNKGADAKGTFQIYAILKTTVDAYYAALTAGKTLGATPSAPVDMTGLIVNPNARFWKDPKPFGWTTTGTQNINNGAGYDGFPGVFEFSDWNAGNWTGSLKQTITVPNGKYKLKAAFMAATGVTVHLTANEDKSDDLAPIGDNGGNINADGTETTMGSGQRGFKYLTVETTVTTGSLEIGTYGEASAEHLWVNADNFTLSYLDPCISVISDDMASTGGAMAADQWYKFTVATDGDYNFSPIANIVISDNGDQLLSTSTGDALTATKSLTTGTTYYVKSTTAQTLTIAPASYTYVVGEATVDKPYIQQGNAVTVSYEDLATNSGASPTKDFSGVTFGGNAIAVTPTDNGFTFIVPAVTSNTDYTLAIPANAIGYAAGSTYNDAQNITLKTPAVLDGAYFIATTDGKQFISRGGDSNTEAALDEFGIAVNFTTDANNVTMLQLIDNERYIFGGSKSIYTDKILAHADVVNYGKWTVAAVSGGISIYNNCTETEHGSYHKYMAAGTGQESKKPAATYADAAYTWKLVAPAAHAATMATYKDANAEAVATAAGLSATTVAALNTILAASFTPEAVAPTNAYSSVTEKYQPAGYTEKIFEQELTGLKNGIYKVTISAFHRIKDNAGTYACYQNKTDNPTSYLYANDQKIQLPSVMSESSDAAYTGGDNPDYENSGKHYPNNTTAAGAAFDADPGRYKVEVFAVVTDGKLKIGLTDPGKYTDATWTYANWICYKDLAVTAYTFNGDYTALDAAITTAESKTLGFETGEYAPYTNVAAVTALTNAKALSTAKDALNQTEIDAAATALTSATWTVNTKEMNAIYDGAFATAANDGAPSGWTMSNNTLGGAYHSRAFVGDDRLSEFNGTKSGLFIRFDGTNSDRGSQYFYGATTGYTMPLKASTKYTVKVDFTNWGTTDEKPLRLNVTGPAGFSETGLTVNSTKNADSGSDAPDQIIINFTTESAGNYTISFQCPGSDDNKHNNIISNVELYKSVAANMTITDAKYATFIAPFDVAIPSGVTASTVTNHAGKTLTMSSVETTIPANTPVILYKDVTEEDFVQNFYGINTATENTYTVGLLTGNLGDEIDAPVGSYVLQNQSDVVAFYNVTSGNQPKVGKNRAYVNAGAFDAAIKAFYFDDDEATAIEGLDVLTSGEYDAIYNAAGIQVEALQKGLNIVVKDGKSYKIYVK